MRNIIRHLVFQLLSLSFFMVTWGKSPSARELSSEIQSLISSGQKVQAIARIHQVLQRSEYKSIYIPLKLKLGQLLLEMDLPQVAKWQFVSVITSREKQFHRAAIEQLAKAALELGDDTILKFAVSKIAVENFPPAHKDLLFFLIGQAKQEAGEYLAAISAYNRVGSNSRYWEQAKYNSAVAHAENRDVRGAIDSFKELLSSRPKKITDDIRIAALMGLARSYYQGKDWEKALRYYRAIPRDHKLWHAALFESSWAALRDAKFRSALSNFQSLHSSYYENYYVPESLILRATVYLYICKYDEIDKVLGLYGRSYLPVRAKIVNFLKVTKDPLEYYLEIEKALQTREDMKIGKKSALNRLPYMIVNHLIERADIDRNLTYLRKLHEERRRVDSLPASLSKGPFGTYAQKLLSARIRNAKVAVADSTKFHLIRMKDEIKEFYEQADLIRYERLSGQREDLTKRVARGAKTPTVDQDLDRNYYVKNGYEYWAFKGEYWLDEVGNYFYLGRQQCE